MSDFDVMTDSPGAGEEPATQAAPKKRARARWSDDPVVRGMMFATLGLVLLFLTAVLGVLVTGVADRGAPATLAEKEIAVGEEAVRKGSTDTAVWMDYISALILNEQYARAEQTIEDGRAVLAKTAAPDLLLAEARLLSAQESYTPAIAKADEAMKQMKAALDKRVAAGGQEEKTATIEGLPDNYYSAVLVKALAFENLKQWDKVVEQYDIYLKEMPTAADILVDRAQAKAELGDTAGAEKDYRGALKFIPDNEEANAGLAEIGVEK